MKQDKTATVTVRKPFLKGKPTDENTFRNILRFFGLMLLLVFMTFIVCTMTGFSSAVLRIAVNLAIETLILFILFNRGTVHGTEAVSRGEILYQHQVRGQEVTENERKLPYHPAKGFLNGILGTLLMLIPAIVLAFTAQRQMTGAGVLPGWMESYLRRDDIGNALVSYTNPGGISVTEILRIIVRICIMPFISMIGGENKEALLIAEKLSPILLLLPACAYGIGYLQGPKARARIHTEIAENTKKRIRREKKARKTRQRTRPHGPQQLN